jgi:hypothetical protein
MPPRAVSGGSHRHEVRTQMCRMRDESSTGGRTLGSSG